MSEHILAMTTPSAHAALFDASPAPWDIEVRRVQTAGEAVRALEGADDCRLVLIERELEPQPGRLVNRLRRARPGVDIVLLTPAVSEPVRAELMAQGVALVDRGLSPVDLRLELQLRFERASLQARIGILGNSARIHELLETLQQIGPTEIPVLITGPSGSGKELVARSLYTLSPRRDQPFVAINVGALAESVLESELFGHEKGAFTGAIARKAGVFERADGGTLFLDEVGEMSPHMQVRLLRALESGEITPVGGTQVLRVDVRLLAATNRRLEDLVRKGIFREDLYYRLKVVSIEMPSLAERREDLLGLVHYFLVESSQLYGTRVRGISEGALRALHEYSWPGNVRELRNVVFRMAVLAKGTRIEESDVPAEVRVPPSADTLPVRLNRTQDQAERDILLQSLLALRHDIQEVLRMLRGREAPAAVFVEPGQEVASAAPEEPEPQSLRQGERELIRTALQSVGGNRRLAAERLGIAERTLYRKIKEYSLS
jgi:DNA-binding NtrC family response regulator